MARAPHRRTPHLTDPAMVREVASRVLDRESIEIIDWRKQSIHAPFNRATGGLYRVSGSAIDRGEILPWSAILKVARRSGGLFGGNDDLRHSNYWKREYLIYESRVLENLPGIRAAKCYGMENGRSSAAIWLEDLSDLSSARWDLDRYRLAARRLGEFNGAYLTERPVPSRVFPAGDSLRSFAHEFTEHFSRINDLRDQPMIVRCWPNDLIDRVLELWEEREMFLAALDRLPRTFCHNDAFPRNLFVDERHAEVVAVDWAFAGIGPVGSELAPMVAASVFFYDAEPEEMQFIDSAVFESYIEGLERVGWNGDVASVRFAASASAALRYGLFPLGVVLLNDDARRHFERVLTHSAIEIADRWSVSVRFLMDQADAVRSDVYASHLDGGAFAVGETPAI
ncbi:MAG: phosphotransferase [Gemmatimonadaceae bacterium]